MESQKSLRLGFIILRQRPILLTAVCSALGFTGCEGGKDGRMKQDKPAPAPAKANPTEPGDGSTQGSGSAIPEKLVFEGLEVLEKKLEVKAYHLLVKDRGEEFSGYCIAASKDPELPQEALKSFVVKQGPCPLNLSIDGSKSNMAYVCKPIEIDATTTHQVVLYGKLQTGEKYEDIRQIKPEIVLAFCSNPHL